jgi:hypothetical protein
MQLLKTDPWQQTIKAHERMNAFTLLLEEVISMWLALRL